MGVVITGGTSETTIIYEDGGLTRGGSVPLNSFEPFLKWISRSAMPRSGLVATG